MKLYVLLFLTHTLWYSSTYRTPRTGVMVGISHISAKCPGPNAFGRSKIHIGNMERRYQRVQAWILSKNPKAFNTHCMYHNLNLLLSNIAKFLHVNWVFCRSENKILLICIFYKTLGYLKKPLHYVNFETTIRNQMGM